MYTQLLRESIISRYCHRLKKANEAIVMKESIKSYHEMVKVYRDNSVNPIIIASTYQ